MAPIGQGQLDALVEAYHAVISVLPSDLRKEFPLIGGASLLFIGGTRNTEDLDFAVSTNALHAFTIAAALDNRFTTDGKGTWTYHCTAAHILDLNVSLEFLSMGGGFVSKINVMVPIGDGFRASMGELAKMKAITYDERGERKDLVDFWFLIQKMEETGEGFGGVVLGEDEVEIMKDAAEEGEGNYAARLASLLGNAH